MILKIDADTSVQTKLTNVRNQPRYQGATILTLRYS